MKRGREDMGFGGGAKRPVSNMPRPGQAPPGQMHRLTTNDALSYLREVKNRFADKKEVYDTFLEIMKEFKAQRIDTSGVIIRVKDLFRGHKELVLGFNTFLPKGYEIQLADVADMDDDVIHDEVPGRGEVSKVPVEFDQAINYVNKIKTRFAQDERVYKAFLEILNMYRKGQKTITNVYDEVAVLFRNHSDLLTEFTFFLPDNSPPTGGNPLLGGGGGARMGQRNNWPPGKPGGGPGRMVVPGRPGDRSGFGMGGLSALNKRKSARPGDFGRGFDEDMRGGQTLQKELMFFDRVKARLRNREAYQDFLKCLNLFATEIVSRNELISLVHDIIGRHADLMAGFTHFLNRCETMDSFDADLKAIAAHTKMGGKDLVRIKGQSMREKFLSKPISELAADMCSDDRCTTSYVRVPPGYPKLRCTGRTALGDEVLNDTWVSIISGSEDYSFKLMRKNQYEEALFRCEDDRYELDMCIETNASTMRALEPIANMIMTLSGEDRTGFRLDENVLSPVHYRAVERLYDQQGPQMVELLKKNPCVSVPVVLLRLQQKDAEWRRVREEMNKLWRKVFEQNYHKSLDHRSFYFKQADKKGLLPKTMLAEVREAADKRRADDRMLKSLAVGCPLSEMLQADLSYEYPDRQVFDDVFLVTMYAVEEMLSTESKESVAKFWFNMVEPFFGLPHREYTQLHAVKAGDEDEHKEDKADDRKSSSSEQEEGPNGQVKREDGAESAGAGGRDAGMTDAAPTPEPGMTPEPPETDALAALLAAGAAVDTEPERSNLGGDAKGDRGDTSADGPTGRKEEEEEDGSDDEATTRFYALCKPLSSQANAAAGATASSSGTSGGAQVLYGNDQFYYFFRFHRYLYDRMCVAKRCAREKNQPQFRQTGEAPKPLDPEAAAAAREEAEKLHAAFMDMVRRLIDGGMDGSQFEDQCRTLLGTNSYVLFTLDKLIYKFVKHLQTMVADEATVQLWELHKYERARSNGLISDEVYRANANMVLHDDNCYRFEYVQQANAEQQAAAAAQAAAQQQDARAATPPPDFGGASAVAEASVLTVQLLEPDKSELPPTGLDPVFNDYIKGFLGSPAGVNKHHVYLSRNVARPAAGAQVDDALIEALAGVKIRNGLECKISCSNSKVSYVLDTEDVMYRKRTGQSAAFPNPRRTQQWGAFLARRSEAVPAMREYTQNGVMPIGPAPLAPMQPAMPMSWMHQ